MSKQDVLQFKGKVVEILKNAQFRVLLENGHTVTAHTAGKLRKNRIRILNSDNVNVEVVRATGIQGLVSSTEPKK